MYQIIDATVKVCFALFFALFVLIEPVYSYTYSLNSSANFTTDVLLEQTIEGNINTPSVGQEFYVVSNNKEYFYLPTAKGFNYYSSTGELVKSVQIDYSKYRNNSNLVLAENRVIYISKYPPGYVNVFDPESGEVLGNIQIIPDHEQPLNSNLVDFSNITPSVDGKYLFFASHYPSKIYRFNIQENVLEHFDVPTTYGAWYTAPVLVDNSKVLFTSHKGILQLFDQNNISTDIFSKSFNSQYNFLYKQNSASRVPTTYNELSFFTLYQKYICNYDKLGGTNTGCVEFINIPNKESLASTNIVGDSNGVYFIFNKNQNGTNSNYLTFYDNNLDRVWESKINKADIGGVIQDSTNIITSGNSVEYINKQSGKVLGSFDIADTGNSIGVLRTSLVSPTNKGNFYVFAQLYDYNNKKVLPTIYKFRGKNTTNNTCELGFYCQSTPKHRPVILIHGLGGNYKSWFDEKNSIVRNTILQEYKKDDPEFPDSWVHAYSYGYKFDGTYNYQGKIQDISTNLHSDVERLAQQHKKAGGDGKVDLIGYSLGGLVARHYILEKTGFPGDQNINVDHKVGKLILVASPVNGSSVWGYLDSIEKSQSEKGMFLKKLVGESITAINGKDMDLTKDIGLQIGSESVYLNQVRKNSLPDNIMYYRTYGVISLGLYYNLFGKDLVKTQPLGDLVVQEVDTKLGHSFNQTMKQEDFVGFNLSFSGGNFLIGGAVDPIDKSLVHREYIANAETREHILSFLEDKK